jgi:hypothetical protein
VSYEVVEAEDPGDYRIVMRVGSDVCPIGSVCINDGWCIKVVLTRENPYGYELPGPNATALDGLFTNGFYSKHYVINNVTIKYEKYSIVWEEKYGRYTLGYGPDGQMMHGEIMAGHMLELIRLLDFQSITIKT